MIRLVFYGVRTQIKGRLGGRVNGGRLTSFFMSKNGENSGWGYSWGYKVGLHFLKSGVTHSGFLGVG